MVGKYIAQQLDKGATVETPCLPLEDIAALVDDRLDRQSRERVLTHLADCRACYGIYADTLAVRSSMAGTAAPAANARRINRLLVYGMPLALAACLALVVFSGVFKDGTPGNGPAEMKLPGGAPLPATREQKPVLENVTGSKKK